MIGAFFSSLVFATVAHSAPSLGKKGLWAHVLEALAPNPGEKPNLLQCVRHALKQRNVGHPCSTRTVVTDDVCQRASPALAGRGEQVPHAQPQRGVVGATALQGLRGAASEKGLPVQAHDRRQTGTHAQRGRALSARSDECTGEVWLGRYPPFVSAPIADVDRGHTAIPTRFLEEDSLSLGGGESQRVRFCTLACPHTPQVEGGRRLC